MTPWCGGSGPPAPLRAPRGSGTPSGPCPGRGGRARTLPGPSRGTPLRHRTGRRANKKPPADRHRRLSADPVLRSALGNKYEAHGTGHSGSCGGRRFGWHRTGTVKPSASNRPPTIERPARRTIPRWCLEPAPRRGGKTFGTRSAASGNPEGGAEAVGLGPGRGLDAPCAAALGASPSAAGGVDSDLKVLRRWRNLTSAPSQEPLRPQLEGADRCSHSSPTHQPHQP
jgi:hypothetical protein